LLTYKEGVETFRVSDRLSDGDRAKLMDGTASRIHGAVEGLRSDEPLSARGRIISGAVRRR